MPPELELVETDDQITHEITLDDKLEPQVGAVLCCTAVQLCAAHSKWVLDWAVKLRSNVQLCGVVVAGCGAQEASSQAAPLPVAHAVPNCAVLATLSVAPRFHPCARFLPCPTPLQMHLDVFKEDPDFAQHEEEYQAIKREILGDEEEESEEEEGSERERGEGEGSSEEEESSEDDEATGGWTCGGCMYCINMPASWGGCVWQLAAPRVGIG